ncbi:DNA methyltransferase [Streptomyces sp. NBC_01187]|uniref:DNA methyltransferase n=1 Tax=Streptomyces sp. NBC_01187 TaxID=2903766 RepID=UPI0038654B68|nr:site-specific DNA-methyltransferase [Streptomyces sp. NBC_01187]
MSGSSINRYAAIPFEREAIAQRRLDIVGSRRNNALPWRGQFSPDLIAALFEAYPPKGLVVDPFCGSGTTLVEAAHAGQESHGVEVNPAAFILANLYSLCAESTASRLEELKDLEARLKVDDSASGAAEELAEWTLQLSDAAERRVMEAVFLLTLGNGDQVTAPKLEKSFRQVASLVEQLPGGVVSVSAELGDARSISLPDHSAAMVLTSPPYVNVFNYHQNYRKAAEFLGWEILPAARAEFGSNRKHRQNRFLTVIQYAQDIGEALCESKRVVEPGGMSIWVVGRESNVRGEPIPNPEIVFEMATRGAGLDLVEKHERKFRSRYGALVYEDIMMFRHPVDDPGVISCDIAALGREVGVSVLSQLGETGGVVAEEVSAAIASCDKVNPSQIPEFSNGMALV